jgi:large subunit ribosomal protein L29
MRADDIRGMNETDATTRLAELERERFNLRFKSGTQPLEDPLRLRALRKDIARLKTIVKERALGLDRQAKTETATRAPARKAAAKKSAAKKAAGTTAAKKAPAKQAAKSTAAEQGGGKQSASKATAAKKTATKRAAGGRGDR